MENELDVQESLLSFASLVVGKDTCPERLYKEGSRLSAAISGYPLLGYARRNVVLSVDKVSSLVALVGHHKTFEDIDKAWGLTVGKPSAIRKYVTGPFALEAVRLPHYQKVYRKEQESLQARNEAREFSGEAQRRSRDCRDLRDKAVMARGMLPSHMLNYKARVKLVERIINDCLFWLYKDTASKPTGEVPFFTRREQQERPEATYVRTFDDSQLGVVQEKIRTQFIRSGQPVAKNLVLV